MLGELISAGASLLGGMFNRSSAEEQNRLQLQQAQQNMQMQREFAQQGIRWKVEDAKAAGIHPLYALGAQTTSYSPVSIGSLADTSMGSSLAQAGQDIGRAVNATRTGGERVDAYTKALQTLQLQRGELENQLLASQISKLNQAGGTPPMPGGAIAPNEDKPGDRPILGALNKKWETYPGAANAEEFEKRYGDIGEEVAGFLTFLQDAGYNVGRSDLMKMLMAKTRMLPYPKRPLSRQYYQR